METSYNSRAEALSIRALINRIPLNGTFELTPRCNLKCKMCSVRLSKSRMVRYGRELSADEWLRLAQEAASAGTLYLMITGGEPLLREDFAEIFADLSQMGFIITLNTNATLIDAGIIRLFHKYPPALIDVTLYGSSPETYQNVTGDASAFDKAIRGLELISESRIPLEIRSTLIQDNVSELDKLRDIASRYTRRQLTLNTEVHKPVRGAESEAESCRLTPEQVVTITRYNKDTADNGAVSDLSDTIPGQNKNTIANFPPQNLNCIAAKASYWISWDGKMLPCATFAHPYTLPLKEGFINAWNRLPGLVSGISKPPDCLACQFARECNVCPAILQAEGGCDRISPYFCNIVHEYAFYHK